MTDNCHDPYDQPLSDDEFVELGERLAAIPEPFEPMEADRLDGYLAALALLPEGVPASRWMPYVFDGDARPEAGLADPAAQRRLEDLVYRRSRSIEADLARCRPIDPIVFEPEEPLPRGSLAPVAPFAAGFLEAMNLFPGLKDTGDEAIESALIGILRYLPEPLLGDMSEVAEELEEDTPVDDVDEALEDIAESCAEIAEATRGFRKADSTGRPRAGNHAQVAAPAARRSAAGPSRKGALKRRRG